MVSVPAVDHHTLPALSMMWAGFRAAAVIDTALADLLQRLHFEFILLLRCHRLILLPDEFFIVIHLRIRRICLFVHINPLHCQKPSPTSFWHSSVFISAKSFHFISGRSVTCLQAHPNISVSFREFPEFFYSDLPNPPTFFVGEKHIT